MENLESTSGESAAQKQVRLRRERREAKIKAGGSARLDKITSLTGRPQSAPAITPPAVPSGISFFSLPTRPPRSPKPLLSNSNLPSYSLIVKEEAFSTTTPASEILEQL